MFSTEHAVRRIEIAFGERKLGKQLAAADRAQAHVALLVGEQEAASGTVAVKDLRNGQGQQTVSEAELPRALAALGVL